MNLLANLISCTFMRNWTDDYLFLMINCDPNINNILEISSFSTFKINEWQRTWRLRHIFKSFCLVCYTSYTIKISIHPTAHNLHSCHNQKTICLTFSSLVVCCAHFILLNIIVHSRYECIMMTLNSTLSINTLRSKWLNDR